MGYVKTADLHSEFKIRKKLKLFTCYSNEGHRWLTTEKCRRRRDLDEAT